MAKYCSYLKSNKWKALRKKVLKRDGHACRICRDPAEHIHHFWYSWRVEDEKVDQLISVCSTCHEVISDHFGHNGDVWLTRDERVEIIESVRKFIDENYEKLLDGVSCIIIRSQS